MESGTEPLDLQAFACGFIYSLSLQSPSESIFTGRRQEWTSKVILLLGVSLRLSFRQANSTYSVSQTVQSMSAVVLDQDLQLMKMDHKDEMGGIYDNALSMMDTTGAWRLV